jgi:hypothetical protein
VFECPRANPPQQAAGDRRPGTPHSEECAASPSRGAAKYFRVAVVRCKQHTDPKSASLPSRPCRPLPGDAVTRFVRKQPSYWA